MEHLNNDELRDFLNPRFHRQSDFLESLRQKSETEGVPIIHRDVADFLSFLIGNLHVKNILEIGTAVGFSALVMHEAMNGKGRVTSIERDEELYRTALENTAGHPGIKLVMGDALSVISELNDKFDLVFIDGAKSHYKTIFKLAMPLLAEGAVIVSDNIFIRGLTYQSEIPKRHRTMSRNMNSYVDFLYQDDKKTILLPIGDGLAVTSLKG